MEVEPSVIKKELLNLKRTVENAQSPKQVARKLDDIGFDHIPTTQYRSGTQIRTELLTKVSDLVATAKQGEDVNRYINKAQQLLTAASKINLDGVYSTRLINNGSINNYSPDQLMKSIDKDLKKFE